MKWYIGIFDVNGMVSFSDEITEENLQTMCYRAKKRDRGEAFATYLSTKQYAEIMEAKTDQDAANLVRNNPKTKILEWNP